MENQKHNWTFSSTDTPFAFCQQICHFQFITIVKLKKNIAVDKGNFI